MKNYIITLITIIFLLPLQYAKSQPVVRTVIVLGIDDHRNFENDLIEGQSFKQLDERYRLRDMLVLDPQYEGKLYEYDKDMKNDFDFFLEKINNKNNKQYAAVKVSKRRSNKQNLIRLLGNGVRSEIMDAILGKNGKLTTILSPVSLKNNEAIIHVEGYKRNGGFAKYHIKLIGDTLEYIEIMNTANLTKEKMEESNDNQYGLGLRFGIGLAGTGISFFKDKPKYGDYKNNVSYNIGLEYNKIFYGGSISKKRFFTKLALNYSYFKSTVVSNEFSTETIKNITIHEIIPKVGMGYRINIKNINSIDFGAFVAYEFDLLNPRLNINASQFGVFLNATIKKIHLGMEYSPNSRYGLCFNIGYNFGNFKK